MCDCSHGVSVCTDLHHGNYAAGQDACYVVVLIRSHGIVVMAGRSLQTQAGTVLCMSVLAAYCTVLDMQQMVSKHLLYR